MSDPYQVTAGLRPPSPTNAASLRSLRLWVSVVLAGVNVVFAVAYALWSVVDDWAATRAEAHGFDPSMLLPNDAALWVAMNACIVILIALDGLWIVLAIKLRSSCASTA
ncbi:hypothetical protein [Leifsonia shinshuensis]|uniref:hypothetical protein n=1 Tax=Leifsonia shinshuensis TaxID=150026 RepID=UPI0028546219|nr:hypothetical protein [Leifsonia shinshuensis]MDR6970095.1 hypothetical protein [Leifsonia shinshuensis]